MNRVYNKSCIEKCILSFSHNRFDSRAEADKVALEKARREIVANKRGISHLILRAKDDEIDRLKFLFLINGIPVICYALANVLHSSIKKIAIVGSIEVRQVVDAYLNTIGDCGKIVYFIEEDPKHLTLINTMNLGREQLDPTNSELVLFQPGDLPFMYDIEKVIQNKDNQDHNLILWLNARACMFPDYEKNQNLNL